MIENLVLGAASGTFAVNIKRVKYPFKVDLFFKVSITYPTDLIRRR